MDDYEKKYRKMRREIEVFADGTEILAQDLDEGDDLRDFAEEVVRVLRAILEDKISGEEPLQGFDGATTFTGGRTN